MFLCPSMSSLDPPSVSKAELMQIFLGSIWAIREDGNQGFGDATSVGVRENMRTISAAAFRSVDDIN